MKMGDKGIKRRTYWFERHKDEDPALPAVENRLSELFDEEELDRAIACFVDQILGTAPKMKFETNEERVNWEADFYGLSNIDVMVINEVAHEMDEKYHSEVQEEN